ncbi:MAG: hypothetical protein L3J36_05180 [Rhodobacteraceae bacterium]|nr:hypothetical protein [Paracoccaceae bacterium]
MNTILSICQTGGATAPTAPEGMAKIESAGEATLKGFHAPVDDFRVKDVIEIS